MSHEIRTPLTAILGYSDLLRDEAIAERQPPSKVHTIDTIRNAGQHLLTVINDTSIYRRSRPGKCKLSPSKRICHAFFLKVVSLMRSRVDAKEWICAQCLIQKSRIG